MTDGLHDLLARAAERPRALARPELAALLAVEDEAELQALFDAAYALKVKYCGRRVAMRGLVEAGNLCAKDCLYCGIRRSNAKVARYRLSEDEIVRLAELDAEQGYASLVIQSGEIESEEHTRFVEDVLRRIAPLDLGVTLSLGEQTEEVYRRWKEAGAARYLLRIETSNPDLYATLHPANHSWARRVECLRALRRCGYQVGTGVMCGLPGQTYDDLARDIEFYAEMDVDTARREHRCRHGASGARAGRSRARHSRRRERHHAEHHGYEVSPQLPALRRQAVPRRERGPLQGLPRAAAGGDRRDDRLRASRRQPALPASDARERVHS